MNEYKTVAELLESPDRWYQGYYAATEEGESVEANDPQACKWCLLGAIDKVYSNYYNRRDEILDNLINIMCKKQRSVANWNDAPERTHAEVLALVKELGI